MNNKREIALTSKDVTRPSGPWTPTIHQFLHHLHRNGFTQCPLPLSIEANTETVTLVDGETYDYPLKGAIASEEALISAAKLLRKFHDTSAMFIASMPSDCLHWQQPLRDPVEVICHSDFAPYNVALNGDKVVGVFDFDTAHPGPRMWDLAYAVYCWAPFKTHRHDAMGSLVEQSTRARLFCVHYGAVERDKLQLVDCMISRLQSLVSFMYAEADSGNTKFQQDIEQGHQNAYLKDIDYLLRNKAQITRQLCI
ncbi:aminoglycoside phosphotransferase family protein [Enterovibrio sp. ZSDZ35]|uniref:Aminoglycoside phosphotransferase family protein n=1 Tax=Enterovibrio qingdaonensis TaxID=2899818 RepID=A0ABT5QFX4_9GAMM|nr:aminoglycoside phosphotransferase family protein [Enterovibrio sp. ZSDZ35]MDD1779842.1 aminoglycoside phosphotransferase family protein [Enterovibrio sp. ZSDZ35]